MFKRSLIFLSISLLILQCEFPSVADVIAPVLVIVKPTAGSVVSANTTALISASDDNKIKTVEVFLDGISIGNLTETPYEVDLTVTGKKDGLVHTLIAVGEDKEGNIGYSQEVNFIIAKTNDVISPTVSIINPIENQSVTGTVRIVAIANDERSVDKVAFFVDGDSVGVIETYPFHYDWNTTSYAGTANHFIFAKVFDTGGNSTVSQVVNVVVLSSLDITPPTALITYPVNGQTVSGIISVTSDVNDDVAVSSVDFFIDGSLASSVTVAPFSYSWNTASYANGSTHNVYAKVHDASGNTGVSLVTTITIDNNIDITPPTALITYPVDGQTVSGTINVTSDANDNVGVTMVEFYIDGLLVSQDSTAPFVYSWNTGPFADGLIHSIYVKVYDAAGNVGQTNVTAVTVP